MNHYNDPNKIEWRDKIYYSESYMDNYVKEQIELAFKAGLSSGYKIEIHTILPNNDESTEELLKNIKTKLNKEYESEFSKGKVWAIAKNYEFNDDPRYIKRKTY